MNRTVRIRNAIDFALVIAGLSFIAAAVAIRWDAETLRSYTAIVAVVLMVAANLPYVVDSLAGKTTPHVVTWSLLGLITICAWWRQIVDGASFESTYPLLLAGAMNLVNCIIGMRHAELSVKSADLACGAAGILSVVVWLTAKDPLLTVASLTIASLLAYAPTFRKAWRDPGSETFRTYPRNVVRYGLITAAVSPASLATLLYPATWVIVNALFTVMLLIRLPRTK